MATALWVILEQLKMQSPYADRARAEKPRDDKHLIIHVPFHHKVCLWRLVERASQAVPTFPIKNPNYNLFRKTMLRPEFSVVRFHRIVDIGRCPKCKYMEYKIRSVPRAFKKMWQDNFAKHHLQTLQQKAEYQRSRAQAAADYPHRELYLGIDCGSGHEFVLPHISSADVGATNKLLDGLSSVPMKVCNGLVHGDPNSYVILSPGVVGATTSHNIDCISLIVNHVFHRLGKLPPEFALQFDGAATNKSVLLFGWLADLCHEKVFRQCRARCEVEHHAHDLYDQFHSIHATSVKRSTYWSLEELIDIIKAAHTTSSDARSQRPIVGQHVQVLNLWSCCDYWEWYVPGYTDPRTRAKAFATGALGTFTNLDQYRDFLIQEEEGCPPENRRIGLWAKHLMTSKDYTFLGTILTTKSRASVIGNRSPPLQNREIADCKTEREKKVLNRLAGLLRGPFREQFEGKVQDAEAMSARRWSHFQTSSGEPDKSLFCLPHQLGAAIRQRAVRAVPGFSAERDKADNFMQAALEPRGVPVMRRAHVAASEFGFRDGPTVSAQPPKVPRQMTFEAFRASPVQAGTYVISRPAPASEWASLHPKLKRDLKFWLWRVMTVDHSSSSSSSDAAGIQYKCAVCVPASGVSVKGKFNLVWVKEGVQAAPDRKMRTVVEKLRHARKKARRRQTQSVQSVQPAQPKQSKQSKKLKHAMQSRRTIANKQGSVPLTGILRPENIVGGGFILTGKGYVPKFVHQYFEDVQPLVLGS